MTANTQTAPVFVSTERPIRFAAFDRPKTWVFLDPSVANERSYGADIAVYTDARIYAAVSRYQNFRQRFVVEACDGGGTGVDVFVDSIQEGIERACKHLGIPAPNAALMPDAYKASK